MSPAWFLIVLTAAGVRPLETDTSGVVFTTEAQCMEYARVRTRARDDVLTAIRKFKAAPRHAEEPEMSLCVRGYISR